MLTCCFHFSHVFSQSFFFTTEGHTVMSNAPEGTLTQREGIGIGRRTASETGGDLSCGGKH
jgi:hypothetical protein